MYGKKHTLEVRLKCAEAAKGNTNWLGRKHSEVTKAKIKELRAKQIFSEETCKLMSDHRTGSGNAMYGKKHSDESKRKMSENRKGKPAWNKGLKKNTRPVDVG